MVDKDSIKIDFSACLSEKAQQASASIEQVLAEQTSIEPQLKSAMEYALTAPGKRLRAALVLWACEIVSGSINDAAKLGAVSIEMVHTYSLIHDDLPAMDDDDMRRGQPSCHKAFDEATAILAGDALLTLAFEILSTGVQDNAVAAKMITVLSRAAGPAGMIAGQMADMQSQESPGSVELLEYIHTNKTARMFAASASIGAIAANAAAEQIDRMNQYGLNIGLGFQIADDILDITSTSEHLGKTVGKDLEQGKVTYPSVIGLDESKNLAKHFADKAIDSLSIFGSEADILRLLADELLNRTR